MNKESKSITLKEYLELTGISPADFARMILKKDGTKVSEITVKKWIAGLRKPSLYLCAEIERVTKGRVGLQSFI